MLLLQFRFSVSSCSILSLLCLYDDSKCDTGLWHYLISLKPMDGRWNPLVLNRFYCCPSLALPSSPSLSLGATMPPCFIVMFIDRRMWWTIMERQKKQCMWLLPMAWLVSPKHEHLSFFERFYKLQLTISRLTILIWCIYLSPTKTLMFHCFS